MTTGTKGLAYGVRSRHRNLGTDYVRANSLTTVVA